MKEKLASGFLKIFWEKLNEGEIDWETFYVLRGEEKKEATNYLINRGFVISTSKNIPLDFITKNPLRNKFVIKYVGGRIVNLVSPINSGENLYFTSEDYAVQYQSFLLSTKEYSGTNLETRCVDHNLISEIGRDEAF